VIATSVTVRDGTVVCLVTGDLDAFGVSSYREVTSSLAADGRAVVIDLSGVGFIDGAGLGALVGTIRRCRDKATSVALCSPRPTVARALASAGLDRIAPMAATVSEALAITGEWRPVDALGAVPA
jgi:anti-sigma B factor antagonist